MISRLIDLAFIQPEPISIEQTMIHQVDPSAVSRAPLVLREVLIALLVENGRSIEGVYQTEYVPELMSE